MIASASLARAARPGEAVAGIPAPDDAQANGVVGRFRCLVKGDWNSGLPLLALRGPR